MAGMYPDSKTLTIMDKKVLWPALDPNTGKFTNGGFENGVRIPPSYIPAETINLILDNFSELIKSLGAVPNNYDTDQAATAVCRFIDTMTRKMNAMEAACGYRVFAKTTATDSVLIFLKASEGTCLANIRIATSDPRVFLKLTVSFNLWYSYGYIPILTELSVRDESRIDITGYAPSPEVRVDMWSDSIIVLTLTLPSGTTTIPRAGLTLKLPALTSTFWHGTVDGVVSKEGDLPVGQRNLEVIWFGNPPYGYGYEIESGQITSNIIGNMSFNWDDFTEEAL
jgi:hypothetical protein